MGTSARSETSNALREMGESAEGGQSTTIQSKAVRYFRSSR